MPYNPLNGDVELLHQYLCEFDSVVQRSFGEVPTFMVDFRRVKAFLQVTANLNRDSVCVCRLAVELAATAVWILAVANRPALVIA